MLQKYLISPDCRYITDIIFAVTLRCKFKQTIAIISSCKELWSLREEFYKRKHLLWYSKPILNFWTPEQHFYASGREFTLFVRDNTLWMDIPNLFEHNNTVEHIKDEYDYYPTFTITDQWLVVWSCYYKDDRNNTQPRGGWSFTFHKTWEEVKDELQSRIESGDILSMSYSATNLKLTVPCWTNFTKVTPHLDQAYEWVSMDRLGKIISGE